MKYYTPVLEEFGINFEYEVKVDDKWEKRILNHLTSLHNIKVLLEKENIRVRYLNKKDIIECGWIKSGRDFKKYKEKTMYYLCTHNNIKRNIINDIYIQSSIYDCIFEGTIKNISELRKLMHQLEIK
jgi:hypothetical protein